MKKTNDVPDSIRSELLREIKEGIYKYETRLPPETVLAEKMGVSRTQLRDSLTSLEREGFISRRQGIGTIINKHVLAIQTRMDLEVEFLDMVRQAGAEPGISLSEANTIFCDANIAAKLGVKEGTPILTVSRVVTANGKGIIYCVDYISFQLICDYTYSRDDLEKPIFYFLKHFCNTEVHMDVTVVKAINADARIAKILDINEGDPLLNMSEKGYDIDGNIVLLSDEYYVDDILQHTVLRKKI